MEKKWKSTTKEKKKISKDLLFTSGIVMWALLLKYTLMMQVGPEKAMQPSKGC